MMMRRIRDAILLSCLVVAMVLGGVALAQTGGGYDLSWWTVDGGGGTLSGGGYLLEGTIGQPDAGQALTGGGYTLIGGFWQRGGGAAPPICPDLYEPNEDFASARAITPGVAIQAYICDANDQDWFRFNTSAGQDITVDLTNLPQDYDLELYDPGNNLAGYSNAGGTNDEHIDHTAGSTGAYRVHVYGYSGAYDAANPYTLRVQLGGAAPGHKVYIPVVRRMR